MILTDRTDVLLVTVAGTVIINVEFVPNAVDGFVKYRIFV